MPAQPIYVAPGGNGTSGAVVVGSNALDDVASGEWQVELADAATNDGGILHVDHAGSGGSGSYGIDIRNRDGADRAMVIHNYANAQALRIDNTDAAAAVYVVNTANETFNPGGDGTGDAFVYDDHGTQRFKVDRYGTVTVVAAASGHGFDVSSNASAASTRRVGLFRHQHAGNGVEIQSTGNATGFYPFLVTGLNYGPRFTTSDNGGRTLEVVKNGTGTGEALRIINAGTGSVVSIRTSSSTEIARFNADAEFEHLTAGKGLLLRSPDGTRYRVAVANGGTVSVAAA